MFDKITLLSVRQATQEIYGSAAPADLNRMYRMLHAGAFDEIAEKNNCPIIKDGNRFRIPFALIKVFRGEA